jgi:hypothetical protein
MEQSDTDWSIDTFGLALDSVVIDRLSYRGSLATFRESAVIERASLFRLNVGELDHLGPRYTATQIGKSTLCRFPASPKYDHDGFR